MNSPLPAPRPDSEAPVAIDRRAGERKLFRASGLLYVHDHPPMRIRTLDISKKGVALLLSRALPDGTVGELSFHLHVNGLLRQFAAKVEISNNVFLRSDVRAGCRFLSLNEQSRKTLEDFLR